MATANQAVERIDTSTMDDNVVSFNGIGQEVFEGGIATLSILEALPPGARVEALTHIATHGVYSLLDGSLSPEQASSLSRDFSDLALILSRHSHKLEERLKPFIPRPEDD